MKFYIDMAYVTDATIGNTYFICQRDDETSEDFLVRKLSSDCSPIISTRTEDHPEFTILRNKLEELGYIKTERSYWNGDCVLKQFYLNDVKFKKGSQFSCAAALKYTLERGTTIP
jgi:hypothetical protein